MLYTPQCVFHKIYVNKVMHGFIWKSEKYSNLCYIKENCVTDDGSHVVRCEEVKNQWQTKDKHSSA